MFDIADVPFTQVEDEEKMKFTSKIAESGSYRGYKLRNLWVGASSRVRTTDKC